MHFHADSVKSRGTRVKVIGWHAFLDHAIRLVLGRSSSALPEPAQIPRVNSLLKQWGMSVAGNLYDAVAGMRRAVRKVYGAMVIEAQ